MLNLATGILTAAIALTPLNVDEGTSASSTVAPSASEITIDVATVNGSGCPVGTAAVAISEDAKAFTVTYSDYLVTTAVGGPTQENCQISSIVNVPGGFTYAISKTDYRGYGELGAGVTGQLRGRYYFQGMSPTAYTVHEIKGPVAGDWQATDEVAVTALVWHPCGAKRNLNVNTRLTIATNNTNDTKSYLTMDSTDQSFSTLYHFAWMTCPAA